MKTYIVDSFTAVPFSGNPAGVCMTEEALAEGLMLRIAKELNLSETAFLLPTGREGEFQVRYFSPMMEIPLCGHATLAAGKVISQMQRCGVMRFLTGNSTCLEVSEEGGVLSMGFPRYVAEAAEVPLALLDALGVGGSPPGFYNAETGVLMIEIPDAGVLAGLAPDFAKLMASHDSINGVLVTAAGDAPHDFSYRYFWPWSGGEEDPVTGGVQTFLAPYWARKDRKDARKDARHSVDQSAGSHLLQCPEVPEHQ